MLKNRLLTISLIALGLVGCGPSGGTTQLPQGTGTENFDPYADSKNPDTGQE